LTDTLASDIGGFAVKKWMLIALAAAIIVAVPVVIFAKRYYDARYVLDDHFYTVVPLDYDITPTLDAGGRITDYTLTGYNADGEARELTFSVLIDAHKSDLYPPGTFIRMDVSKQLVIGRRAIDEAGIPEKAAEKIKAGFTPVSASSLPEYADERTGQLAAKNTASLTVSCGADGSALNYVYTYVAGERSAAEAAAELLDPVYCVQFRTDKDTFPGLIAIYLEIRLDDGATVFSQKYDTRVEFDYEKREAPGNT